MKRKIVIVCLCGLALTGTVFAATRLQTDEVAVVNEEQEKSSTSTSKASSVQPNETSSKQEVKVQESTNTIDETVTSSSTQPTSQKSRNVNSNAQNGGLITFSDAEYESDFQRDEANYKEKENDAEYDLGEYNNSSIAAEAGNVIEFVTYTDQELNGVYSSFIVTNLSSNSYNMNFYVYNGDKLLATVNGVVPGGAESVELARVLGEGNFTLTVVSEAVTSDGTVLDSLEQEVAFSVKDIADAGVTTGTTKENQASGSVYETSVVYDAESMQCSVVLPAVLSVAKGEIGTDFDISYRIVGVKTGTKFALTAVNGLDADSAIKLITSDGANGELSTVNANLKMGTAGSSSLDFVLDTTESVLHTVGPVHCFLSNDKVASGNYYGTTRFKISIEEG